MALFDCFKKKEPTDRPKPDGTYDEEGKPSEETPEGSEVDRYKRLAILVGHTKSDSGTATYSFNGKRSTEYDWNKARAEEIKEIVDTEYPNKITKIFYRDGIGRRGAAKEVGDWDADLCLELHLNAVSYVAYGCEMLVLDGDTESAEVGRKFTDALYETGVKKRHDDGIKWMGSGDRGASNLEYVKRYGTKIRMLIEPFFCNPESKENRQFIEEPTKYSRLIADVLGKLR